MISIYNSMTILKKGGSLRFWSEWFGRPHDNFHIPISAELDGNVLTIFFNEGEKCTVYDPSGIVNKPDEFYIVHASRIIWEWYYYGKAHTPENLCRRVYTDERGDGGAGYALELC